jgi:hypothetical protein
LPVKDGAAQPHFRPTVHRPRPADYLTQNLQPPDPDVASQRVHRRVFQRLLDQSPTPERCLEAYHLQRTRFELAVERKLRRRQLTDDGNVEIGGRDLRQREARKTAGELVLERIAG